MKLLRLIFYDKSAELAVQKTTDFFLEGQTAFVKTDMGSDHFTERLISELHGDVDTI
jgi:hypothetical protein